MRSFFLFTTKKALEHLKAWWETHHAQFTVTHNGMVQGLVPYVVAGTTSTLLIMPTATNVHTQTLATPILFQVEYRTGAHSWLGLTPSHQTTGKCFILLKPLFIVSLPSQVTFTMWNKFFSRQNSRHFLHEIKLPMITGVTRACST